MRFPIIAASVAAVIAGAAHAHPSMSATGEDKIASALAGRTAGAPKSCIYQHDIRATRIIDRTAILYEMNDGTIYLNRPNAPEFLNSHYALVTNTTTDELCNVDIVRLLDTQARFNMGAIGLGDFVPYPKPPKAR